MKIGWLFLLLVCWTLAMLPANAEKPDFILITIDTLRADHLGCYGYKGGTSPNLDRFAAGAIRFQNAFSAVPLTLPSHATILTGLYPNKHSIRDNGVFPPPPATLAQRLQQAGYHTAAFVSGSPLLSSFSLGAGFDVYDDDFSGTERKADRTTDRALQWLQQAPHPRFLWIHYYDPHAGYNPPSPFKERFASNPYDGEIAFVDQQIGRLLERTGDATVIITADHGEGLGEHGELSHGVFLYNSTLLVPLLLKAPGIQARVQPDSVSLVDIAPTILQLAGSDAAGLDGVSLLATQKERILYSESLCAQRNFGFAPLFAEIDHGSKFILAPKPELYNLQKDPRESANVYKAGGSGEGKKLLQKYIQTGSKQTPEIPVDEENAEKLRSLGYIGGRNSQASNIDPKDRIAFIEDFNKAMSLLETRQYAEAESAFEKFVSLDSENALAFRFLGDALSAQGKFEDAANRYAQANSLMPDPETAIRLAKCEYSLGQKEKAEESLRQTIQQFPDYIRTPYELASLYAGEQRWEEARALLKGETAETYNQRGILDLMQSRWSDAIVEFKAAIQSGTSSRYWNNAGIAYQQNRDIDDAEAAFRKALELNPEYDECRANLAFLLIAKGNWSEALPHLKQVTASNSTFWKARLALAMCLENLDRKSEARTTYEQLLKDAPVSWPGRSQVEQRLTRIQQ